MATRNPSLTVTAPWVALASVVTVIVGWGTELRIPLALVATACVLFCLYAHIKQRGWDGASPPAVATIGLLGLVVVAFLALSAALIWIGVTRGLHD
jgi:hypothetical protein